MRKVFYQENESLSIDHKMSAKDKCYFCWRIISIMRSFQLKENEPCFIQRENVFSLERIHLPDMLKIMWLNKAKWKKLAMIPDHPDQVLLVIDRLITWNKRW